MTTLRRITIPSYSARTLSFRTFKKRSVTSGLPRQRDQHYEAAFDDIQEKLEASEVEILELRAELEGAQQNAVVSTNRIIHLEAEASAVRHRLKTVDAENEDLRDELGHDY